MDGWMVIDAMSVGWDTYNQCETVFGWRSGFHMLPVNTRWFKSCGLLSRRIHLHRGWFMPSERERRVETTAVWQWIVPYVFSVL